MLQPQSPLQTTTTMHQANTYVIQLLTSMEFNMCSYSVFQGAQPQLLMCLLIANGMQARILMWYLAITGKLA